MTAPSPDELAATVRDTLHRAIPEHLRGSSVGIAALEALVARCKVLERQMGELDAAFVSWRHNHRAELEAAEAEVARLTAALAERGTPESDGTESVTTGGRLHGTAVPDSGSDPRSASAALAASDGPQGGES